MNWSSLIWIILWALLPGFIAHKKGRNFWIYFLLSFFISPLITTIITLCLSKINTGLETVSAAENQPKLARTANSTENYLSTNIGDNKNGTSQMAINRNLSKVIYCRRCGKKLIEGSKFCSNCGNEIEKDGAL